MKKSLNLKFIGLGLIVLAGLSYYLFASGIVQGGGSGSFDIVRNISDPVYPGSSFEVVLHIRADRKVSNLSVIEETGNLSVVSSPSGTVHNNSISWYMDDIEGNKTVKYTVVYPVGRYETLNLSGRYETGRIKGVIGEEKEVNTS